MLFISGIDFGIRIQPLSNLSVGVLIKDLRSGYSWNTGDIFEQGRSYEESFTTEIKVGFSYYLEKYNLLIAADISNNNKTNTATKIGAEYLFHKRYWFRCGFDHTSPVGGFGFQFSPLGKKTFLDYAIVSEGIDGYYAQIISWSFQF